MLNVLPKINGPVRVPLGNYEFPKTIVADLGGFEDYCLTAFSDRTGIPVQEAADVAEQSPWLFLNKIEAEKALFKETKNLFGKG